MAQQRNKRNPTNNAILQALIDCEDAGLATMKVADLIVKINNDSQLRTSLQTTWNRHAYPETSMSFAQLTIGDYLMTLSDTELKLAIFLGLHCHQSGLIQISIPNLVSLTGIKRTTCLTALRSLQSCGAIRKWRTSSRHDANIWQVNPAFMLKGVRSNAKAHAYNAAISDAVKPEDYLLRRQRSLVAHERIVHDNADDGTRIAWNEVTAVAPGNTEEPPASKPKRRPRKPVADDGDIPGQMTIEDYPAFMPPKGGEAE